MKRACLILLLLFISYAACLAQRGGMNYFAGTWQLQGRTASNVGSTPDYSATWTVEKGLDSAFCLAGRVVLNGKNFTRELMTYDATGKAYQRQIWANDGSHFVFSSIGWQKNTLTWTGRQYKDTQVIDMMEKVTIENDNAFSAAFYSKQNGKWVLMMQETLQRQE